MKIMSVCSFSTLAIASVFGGSAIAGGYVSPVVEPSVVVAPIIQTAPLTWAGAYVGGSLGYTFGGDDEVGLEARQNGATTGLANDLTEVDIKGISIAGQAGYRWQRNRIVFGPELAIEGGSIDDRSSFTLGAVDASVESSVNYLVSLTFKTGYLVDPQTMIYGLGGFVHGDFDYQLNSGGVSAKQSYSDNGYVVGLGAERKINERLSVFGEYTYRHFDKEDVSFKGDSQSLVTVASPSHSNIRVGMNYSF